MKVEIKISIIHCYNTSPFGAGAKCVFATDPNHWISGIKDISLHRYIRIDPYEDVNYRMIKFKSDGFCICSYRRTQTRNGEYLASVVFFPAELQLDSNKIIKILTDVEKNVKESSIRDECFNEDILKNICNTYRNDVLHKIKFDVPVQQQGYAFRYVDGQYRPLKDILSNGFQSDFAKYDWVVLMPENDISLQNGANIEDISSKPLKKSMVLQPISHAKFKPYYKGILFESPIVVNNETPISIEWKHVGYKTVTKTGNTPEQLCLKEEDIYRVIHKIQFKVFNSSNQPLRQESTVQIIPGNWDDRNQCWFVPEKKISQAIIEVSARGYEPHPLDRIDLGQKAVNEDIIIRLKEEVHIYRFNICLDKDQRIYTPEFTWKSQCRILSCPFPGYKVQGGSPREDSLNTIFIDEKYYRDKYVSAQILGQGGRPDSVNGENVEPRPPKPPVPFWKRWRTLKLICLIGFVVVATCFCVYWFIIRDKGQSKSPIIEDKSKVEQVQIEETEVVSPPEIRDYTQAIQYLKQKTKFKRDEMESIYGLSGLWDMLNTYNFQAINDFVNQSPELKQSSQFCDILNIIQKNPQISGKFCSETDYVITVTKYTDRLKNSLIAQPSNRERSNNTQQNINPSVHNRPAQNPAGNSNTGASTNNNSQTSADNS